MGVQIGGKPVFGAALYPSVARTVTPDAVSVQNDSYGSLVVVLDITAVVSTPSLVVTIDGQDPASGKWYNILTSAAKTGTGTTALRVSPNIAAVTNLIAQDILPEFVRVTVTHGNANSATYTVGAVFAV